MKKRLMQCLALAVGLLATMSAAFAATPAPSTVHADMPGIHLVLYYESEEVVFVSADNSPVYAITYNGSTYLPLRSAGEWMGKEVKWDATAQTVTLSGKVTPEVKRRGYEYRESTQAERNEYYGWLENGVDAQLRPDIAVLLDGTPQTFVNIKGESVYPIAWNGTVYLPLRNIGELCGLEVFYEQSPKIVGDGRVHLRMPMTDSEKKAIADYLEQGIAMGKLMAPREQQIGSMTDKETAQALEI